MQQRFLLQILLLAQHAQYAPHINDDARSKSQQKYNIS